jgi:hypothetical protein
MMNTADIDPEYYRNDDDGNEPSGYWLLSPRFNQQRRIWWETKKAVDEGRACWVRLESDIPF